MVSIKTFQDGDRTIIVIDNCHGQIMKKTAEFLTDLMGLSDDTQEVTVQPTQKIEGLEPMHIIPQEIPDTSKLQETTPAQLMAGDYNGLSTKEALEADGVKAAASILAVTDNPDDIQTCKEYIFEDVYMRKKKSEFRASDLYYLINDYKILIKDVVDKKIVQKSGFSSLKDFMKHADGGVQQKAFEFLIEYLMNQCS